MDVGATEKAIRMLQDVLEKMPSYTTPYPIVESSIRHLKRSLRTYLTGRE